MTVDVNKFNSVKQLVLTLSTSHSDTSVFSLLEVCLFILFCIYMYYPSDFFNLVNSVDSNQTPRSAVYDVSLILCCRYLLRYARHYWFSQKLIHLYQWAQSDPDMQCSFNSHRTFKKFPIKKNCRCWYHEACLHRHVFIFACGKYTEVCNRKAAVINEVRLL